MSLKAAPRIPLKLDVEFRKSYARKSAVASLKNISLTGAFLECPQLEAQSGDKLNLVFSVSGRTRTVAAEVIWHSPRGAGVRFVPENNRDVQIVDDLMYFVQNRRDSRRSVLEDIFKKVS